jgi:hypothetical protein
VVTLSGCSGASSPTDFVNDAHQFDTAVDVTIRRQSPSPAPAFELDFKRETGSTDKRLSDCEADRLIQSKSAARAVRRATSDRSLTQAPVGTSMTRSRTGLHELVCAGKLGFGLSQRVIAINWYAAHRYLQPGVAWPRTWPRSCSFIMRRDRQLDS